MTNEQTILNYASSRGGKFARKEFFSWLRSHYPEASTSSYDVVMYNMIGKGRLLRTGRGQISVPSTLKQGYMPKISEEAKSLYARLQEEYPYANICIWSVSAVSSFVQHVPYSNTIIIEVEKLAMEAVFHSVKAYSTERTVLLNPTQKEYDLYSTHNGNVIVKPLISEAPTIVNGSVVSASLEKILVDIAIEPGFSFASDSELYTIYENAFEMYDINTRTMLRYASRRGKKEEIQHLINSVTL